MPDHPISQSRGHLLTAIARHRQPSTINGRPWYDTANGYDTNTTTYDHTRWSSARYYMYYDTTVVHTSGFKCIHTAIIFNHISVLLILQRVKCRSSHFQKGQAAPRYMHGEQTRQKHAPSQCASNMLHTRILKGEKTQRRRQQAQTGLTGAIA